LIYDAEPTIRLTLKIGETTYAFDGIPHEDFPNDVWLDDNKPITQPEGKLSIPSDTLYELLHLPKLAISTDETRYYLNGVFIEPRPDNALRTVATDGHRMIKITRTVEPEQGAVKDMPSMIIPRRAVFNVTALIKGSAEPVLVQWHKTKLRFSCGPWALHTKTIDATFPDYERVGPTKPRSTVSFDVEQMLGAIEKVAAISTFRRPVIALEPNSAEPRITCRFDGQTASTPLSASLDGQPIEIGFNSAYLDDFGQLMAGPAMLMHLQDAESPVEIMDPDDEGFSGVLMPVRCA
jgi:DNA polymerase-3 subunit beta